MLKRRAEPIIQKSNSTTKEDLISRRQPSKCSAKNQHEKDMKQTFNFL
jgi:hypothetical protein